VGDEEGNEGWRSNKAAAAPLGVTAGFATFTKDIEVQSLNATNT
jgi:hypothetical protein